MIHGEHPPGHARPFNELVALGRGLRHRLLDEHMAADGERLSRDRIVRGGGRQHMDDVRRRGFHRVQAWVDRGVSELAGKSRRTLAVDVCDADDVNER